MTVLVASRRVQRLHLRAPDDTLARRGARLIEDAVRTASLPDAGARLIVFRRFALGRFRSGIAPQTLALALERRVAALRDVAVHATAATAAQASVVWFRDALEAHTLLAQRVAAGAAAAEWFWPLVVPGIDRHAAAPRRLRLVLQALARCAEAPAALPALARALAWQGHADLVRAALGAAQAAALLDAGPSAPAAALFGANRIIAPDAAVAVGIAHGTPPRAHALQMRGDDRARQGADAAALRVEGTALVHPDETPSAGDAATEPTRPVAASRRRAEDLARLRPSTTKLADPAAAARPPVHTNERHSDDTARKAARARRRAADAMRAELSIECSAQDASPVADTPPRARSIASPTARPSGERETTKPDVAAAQPRDAADASGSAPRETPAWPYAAPTQAGGLLFLLPVLTRLGYAQWLDAAPEWVPLRIDRRVLALACARLALPADDPAWLACDASALPAPTRYCAPTLWLEGIAACDGAWRSSASGNDTRVWDASGRLLLAAWRGRRRPAKVIQMLSEAREKPARPTERAPSPHSSPRWREGAGRVSGDSRDYAESFAVCDDLTAAVTAAWLTACRRWLRRYARIGVASLVARPARLSLTPTHADVFFALSDVSLAVRRSGLDLDPGWVPWFGRVVSFHYGDAPWI